MDKSELKILVIGLGEIGYSNSEYMIKKDMFIGKGIRTYGNNWFHDTCLKKDGGIKNDQYFFALFIENILWRCIL